MKFFLSGLGNWFTDLDLITKAVIEADKLGFYGALMPDHYMWGETDWNKRPDRNYTLETWTTLTYLGAKTEQIHLGTLVTPIPFRPPAILAKMLSTLDVLSNGRVVLGVGAGWSQPEFEGYSEWNTPKVRVDKTIEGIELMIKLWTQDKVTFNGKHYKTNNTILEPKPAQKPYPKLLFGGKGKRMLKLAAKYADICYIPPWNGTETRETAKQLVLTEAKKHGRADKIAFMANGTASEGSYNSKEYSTRVEKAVEENAAHFLVSFPRNSEYINTVKKFAREVMPSFR